MTTTTDRHSFIAHLSPTALAVLSVELEAAERDHATDSLLDAVNAALRWNVGEEEAEQHRVWCRENIS